MRKLRQSKSTACMEGQHYRRRCRFSKYLFGVIRKKTMFTQICQWTLQFTSAMECQTRLFVYVAVRNVFACMIVYVSVTF